ncbi:MAG: putative drug exporter of the superfamily [Thermomicrobiales bacterium]|nr:putative drug exporter of the superfamily [Thermomicrobiales bacterium]
MRAATWRARRTEPARRRGRRPEGDVVVSLARTCHDHPWRVGAVWAVILALGLGCLAIDADRNEPAAGGTAHRLDWATLLGGLDAARGESLIRNRLGSAPVPTDVLCARLLTIQEKLPGLTFDESAASSAETRGLVADLARCREGIPTGTNPFETADVAAVLPVSVTRMELSGTPREVAVQAVQEARRAAARWVPTGVEPEIPATPKERSAAEAAAGDLQRAERIGIIIALVVLAFVLRSVVAPIVPILLGIASVGVALGVASAVRGFVRPPFYVAETISMIGLAISIDYALFVIHRCCEDRPEDRGARDLAETAAAAIRTVLASGAMMIAAMAGMLLVPVAVVRDLAFGAMLVVAVGVAATTTLLPPVVRALGGALHRPARFHRPVLELGIGGRGAWARIGRWTTRHPVVSIAIVAAFLIPLNLEARGLLRDVSGFGPAPATSADAERRVEDVQTAYSTAILSVVEVTVDGRRSDSVQQGIDRLVSALGQDHRFAPVVAVQWNASDDLAVISALLTDERNDTESLAAIDRLRDDVVAEAFRGIPASVSVTGPAAARAEILHTFNRWEDRVRFLVLASSFLLLLLIFRSVVVPLKAIAINLITVGAVHGLLVLVFQKGVGAERLGFQTTPAVEAWVPLFLFCVLFGLSMDYHVFLLSRIREHFRRTGDHQASLVAGLQTTGGVITGAATIMAVVFATFAIGRVPALQQIGFGLAAAVILDATVVRCVLTPAVMELLGDANWYLPRWLRWLPDPGVARGERIAEPASLPAD